MVWVGRAIKDLLVPTLPTLDQVAQSPVQPDLEHFHGWGNYELIY